MRVETKKKYSRPRVFNEGQTIELGGRGSFQNLRLYSRKLDTHLSGFNVLNIRERIAQNGLFIF